MYLYDDITPALRPASYRLSASSHVTVSGQDHAFDQQRFFDVEGPRFSLPGNEVAGVFPPRNAHGTFQENIPLIVLNRRTLPWERELVPNADPPPTTEGGPPPPRGQLPWVALLLFAEGEYTLQQQAPLEQVVPADVFQRLGSPAGIKCDAVQADTSLVQAIMPSQEEVQLLCHVRQVNVEDRELSAGSTNGWFAVVMSNRLPESGTKYRACLISLEQRSDLVPIGGGVVYYAPAAGDAAGGRRAAARFEGVSTTTRLLVSAGTGPVLSVAQGTASMVLLHSWQFECAGAGTFRDLMVGLDVGLMGKSQQGKPAVTDTGHIVITVQDRAGVPELAWYRGPLVPYQLTRDPLGPYHSADQARRVTPETGTEDISYAAAFEAGRLLAAADGRLAQDIMRWRRDAYHQSAKADLVAGVKTKLQIDLTGALGDGIHTPLVPVVAVAAVGRVTSGAGPLADKFGLDPVSRTVGLDPNQVAQTWGVSATEAAGILGADAGALGANVPPPARTPRANTTLDAEAADTASLDHLTSHRDRLLNNAKQKLGGAP